MATIALSATYPMPGTYSVDYMNLYFGCATPGATVSEFIIDLDSTEWGSRKTRCRRYTTIRWPRLPKGSEIVMCFGSHRCSSDRSCGGHAQGLECLARVGEGREQFGGEQSGVARYGA